MTRRHVELATVLAAELFLVASGGTSKNVLAPNQIGLCRQVERYLADHAAPARRQPVPAIQPLAIRNLALRRQTMLLDVELKEMIDRLEHDVFSAVDAAKMIDERSCLTLARS